MKTPFCIALLCTMVAGCAGGGSSPPSSRSATLHHVQFRVDQTSTASRAKRRPAYVSAATQSIGIAISSPAGVTVAPMYASLSPGSSGCVSSATTAGCTLSVDLPAGTYSASVATYDGPLGPSGVPTGNALSENQAITFEVTQSPTTVVGVTLFGLPATVSLTPDPAETHAIGDQTSGFALIGTADVRFFVVAYDADGDAIVGPGSPSFSIASSGPQVTVDQQPTAAQPSLVLLRGPAFSSIAATVTASVTNASSFGVTCDRCQTRIAVNAGMISDGFPRFFVSTGQLYQPSTPTLSNEQTLQISKTGVVFEFNDAGTPDILVIPPPYDHVSTTIDLTPYSHYAVDPDGIVYLLTGTDGIGTGSTYDLYSLSAPYTTPQLVWSTTTTSTTKFTTLLPSIDGAFGLEYIDHFNVPVHAAGPSGVYHTYLQASNGTRLPITDLDLLAVGGDGSFIVDHDEFFSGQATLYKAADLAAYPIPDVAAVDLQSYSVTTDAQGNLYTVSIGQMQISRPPYATLDPFLSGNFTDANPMPGGGIFVDSSLNDGLGQLIQSDGSSIRYTCCQSPFDGLTDRVFGVP